MPDPKDDWGEWAMPIDFGILARLPKEGSKIGYHVLGTTVRNIARDINEPLPPEARMSIGIITQRITRWLKPRGMVAQVKVHGAGGAHGYQITERGQRMLAADPDREEERRESV